MKFPLLPIYYIISLTCRRKKKCIVDSGIYFSLVARLKLEVINFIKYKTIQVELIQTSIFQPLEQWYIYQIVAMQQNVWKDKLAIGSTNPTSISNNPPPTHTSVFPLNFLRFTMATITSTHYNWTKNWNLKKKNFEVHQQSHYTNKHFLDLDHQVNYLKHKVQLPL